MKNWSFFSKLCTLFKNRYFLFSFCCLLVLAALFIRQPDRFFYPFLWAEDGVVFYEQAQSGFSSILDTSLAGYFHVYQRLFALLGQLAGDAYLPCIYLVGSLLAALLLVYAIFRAFEKENPLIVALMSLGVVTVPHSGEVFNTLSNAHYYLGAALFLSLFWQKKGLATTVSDVFLVVLFSFSGAYSVLFLPVCILKFYLAKDFFKYSLLNTIRFVLPCLIFLYTIALGNSGFSNEISNILEGCTDLFLELIGNPYVIGLLLFSWCILWVTFKDHKPGSKERVRFYFIALLTAAVLMFIPAASEDWDSLVIGKLLHRHNYIPILLMTIAALYLPQRKSLLAATIAVVVAVQAYALCFLPPDPLYNYNRKHDTIYWPEHLALAKYLPQGTLVRVPIEPPEERWQVKMRAQGAKEAGGKTLDLLGDPNALKSSRNVRLTQKGKVLEFSTLFLESKEQPAIIFEFEAPECQCARLISPEIRTVQENEAWASVSLEAGTPLKKENELARLVFEGKWTTHYPIRVQGQKAGSGRIVLRYNPGLNTRGKITGLLVHCLE